MSGLPNRRELLAGAIIIVPILVYGAIVIALAVTR